MMRMRYCCHQYKCTTLGWSPVLCLGGFFILFCSRCLFFFTVFFSNLINYIYSSCSTFDDMEVFLHGLGLEHLIGLLKVS